MVDVTNRKWTEDELLEKRQAVLNTWPTGKDVDIEEAIEYRKQIPPEKNKAELNRRLRSGEQPKPYTVKIIGRTMVDDQIEHSQKLAEAGVDLIDIFTDAYTRNRQYEKAEAGIEESRKQKKSLLNGYPLVSHGVWESRRVVESVSVPQMMWSSCEEDPRLSQEIALAAGFTEVGHHCLVDLITHSRNFPLDQRILNDQYCTRLVSYYMDHGSPPISLFTPSGDIGGVTTMEMKLTMLILQILLAAEQGPKEFDVSLNSPVHLVQNVASIRVLRKLFREYLDRFGFNDIDVIIKSGSYHGAWPLNSDFAAGVLAWDISIAVLGGADGFWVKTFAEAEQIPGAAADIRAVRLAKKMIDMVGRQRLPESDELKVEEYMMTLAVKAIVDKVLDLGDGDLAKGMIRAIEAGVIDDTLSSWVFLKKKVFAVRDITGAIRYTNPGSVPLPKEVIDYHRKKVNERAEVEKKSDTQMFIQDVTFISRDVAKNIDKNINKIPLGAHPL